VSRSGGEPQDVCARWCVVRPLKHQTGDLTLHGVLLSQRILACFESAAHPTARALVLCVHRTLELDDGKRPASVPGEHVHCRRQPAVAHSHLRRDGHEARAAEGGERSLGVWVRWRAALEASAGNLTVDQPPAGEAAAPRPRRAALGRTGVAVPRPEESLEELRDARQALPSCGVNEALVVGRKLCHRFRFFVTDI
jgi:hypothetical protein